MIIDKNMDKEYAGIAGYNKFCKLASHLAFKNEMNVESDERIASIQTVSGTGALRIIGEFYVNIIMNKFMENKDIWLPDPTWPNHLGIYRETSLNIKRYNYYDKKTMKFDLNNFLDTINVYLSLYYAE
ncbi:hypothetical protein A3Q56_07688 [Intoshia linei]|uniref:Aspartate aminotransferase, mitochondrial n=1 Tax=Intoshia linei TaxID=1819745 RepID=A0A177ARZ1_9BILA|nr:hypothetical protein A3Q56_07688 [Intoshia linei]